MQAEIWTRHMRASEVDAVLIGKINTFTRSIYPKAQFIGWDYATRIIENDPPGHPHYVVIAGIHDSIVGFMVLRCGFRCLHIIISHGLRRDAIFRAMLSTVIQSTRPDALLPWLVIHYIRGRDPPSHFDTIREFGFEYGNTHVLLSGSVTEVFYRGRPKHNPEDKLFDETERTQRTT